MMSYHTEAYDSADLPRLVKFIYRIRKPEDLAEYPTGVDFEEILDSADVRESTRLWLDEAGGLTGYALIYPLFSATLEADPALDTADLEKEMITWGIEHFRELSGQKQGLIKMRPWIPIVMNRTAGGLNY